MTNRFVTPCVLVLSLMFIAESKACDTLNTCKDIAWCMDGTYGKEFSTPIRDAASKGEGDQVGGDTSACQSKYGQSSPYDWGRVSAGCTNGDYAAQAKKALGGQESCK